MYHNGKHPTVRVVTPQVGTPVIKGGNFSVDFKFDANEGAIHINYLKVLNASCYDPGQLIA